MEGSKAAESPPAPPRCRVDSRRQRKRQRPSEISSQDTDGRDESTSFAGPSSATGSKRVHYLSVDEAPQVQDFSSVFAQLRESPLYKSPVQLLQESKDISNQIVQARGKSTEILVNTCQRGNPVLKYFKNVPWVYEKDILPDYVLGASTCALFLSLRYHLLHSDYLSNRIEQVGREYRVRILLILVDIDDHRELLRELNQFAIQCEFILLLAWSNKEAARYLETFKSYEKKSSTAIQERTEGEFLPQVTNALTSIRSVNKTDVVTLLSTFKTVSRVMAGASIEELALCPGLGEKKVRQLFEAFHEPFKVHS